MEVERDGGTPTGNTPGVLETGELPKTKLIELGGVGWFDESCSDENSEKVINELQTFISDE